MTRAPRILAAILAGLAAAAAALAWTAPEPVLPDTVGAVLPRPAALDSGGLFIAWLTHFNGNHDVYTTHGDSSGWAAPEAASLDLLQDTDPVAVDDGLGGVWVIWVSRRNVGPGNTGRDIYARRWTPAGWGSETAIDLDPGNDSDLAVVRGPGDIVWLFWASDRGGDRAIMTAVNDGYGWAVLPTPAADLPGDDRWPAAAAAPDGRIWLAWTASQNGHEDIAWSVHDGGWSTPQFVTNSSGDDARPAIAIDAAGEPVCVWEQRFDWDPRDIRLARWTGSAWSTPELISSGSLRDLAPSVVCDSAGGIWTAWQVYHDHGTSDYRDDNYEIAVRYHDGSAWGEIEVLTDNLAGDTNVALVRDGGGTVWAFWGSDVHSETFCARSASPPVDPVRRPLAAAPPVAAPLSTAATARVAAGPIGDPRLEEIAGGGRRVRPRALALTGSGRTSDGPAGCGLDSAGRLYVARADANAVHVYDSDGTFLESFGATAPGGLWGPMDVAVTADGRVVVADTGHHRLVLFDAAHVFERVIGAPGSGPGELSRPLGVTLDGGLACVADTGNHRLQWFALDGTFQAVFGGYGFDTGEFVEPGDVTVDGLGQYWVADSWNHRIQVFDSGLVWVKTLEVGVYWPRQIACSPDGPVYYSQAGGELRRIDPSAGCIDLKSDGGGAQFDGLWGVAAGPGGLVLATENGSGRVRRTDSSLTPEVSQPRIETIGPASAVISWSTAVASTGLLDYGPDPPGSYTASAADPAVARDHTVQLDGLAGLAPYVYRTHYVDPWDGSDRTLAGFALTTASSAQQADYQKLRTLLLIYRRFVYRENPVQDEVLITDEQRDAILADAAEFREFYWRASRGRLDLELIPVEISDTLCLIDGDLSGAGSYSTDELSILWPENVKHQLLRAGVDPASFDNVVSLLPFRCYSTYPTGIFSFGCAEDLWGGRGFCAIINCWPESVPWYMVHEGHHNIDGLFSRSGFPDYEHADILHEMEGTFGESWNANGFMARQWPPEQWFGFRWGERVAGLDADGDGLLDSGAPPVTEASYGSSPALPDSDGDGLGDAGEAYDGFLGGTDPWLTDSDGDGIPDGSDPLPRYPAAAAIPRFTPLIDGLIEPEWPLYIEGYLAEKSDPACTIDSLPAYVSWDDDYLYCAFRLDRFARVVIKLDGAGDAWYHGRDNYEVVIDPASETVLTAQILDISPEILCDLGYGYYSGWGGYPYEPPITPADVLLESTPQGTGYEIEVGIPANAWAGLQPAPGAVLGLRFNLDFIEHHGPTWWNASVFERDAFAPVLCTDTPPPVPALHPTGILLLAAGLGLALGGRVVRRRDGPGATGPRERSGR